jgi:chitin disaccharide deacetylase
MIICADDFGLSDDINQAILSLAGAGRLTAISCMINAPSFSPLSVSALRSLDDTIDIGLHLAFTEVPFVSAHSLIPSLLRKTHSYRSLAVRSLLNRVCPDEVLLEIRGQYDSFVRQVGRPPVFIDSHHHAHQLPGVRDGLLMFLQELPATRVPHVRNSYVPMGKNLQQGVSVWKTLFISFFGKALRKRLLNHGVRTNRGFGGIYDYRYEDRYASFLVRFAQYMESETGILMVHPGLIEPWRVAEYQALRDAYWLESTPAPFRQTSMQRRIAAWALGG